MNVMKLITTSAFIFSMGAISSSVLADKVDPIDAEDFVEAASAAGIAEIETARLALRESESNEVRSYAQEIINDHQTANKELKTIAKQKDLEISDDATLVNKSKQLILKMRDGESFDVAYANNQVEAHQKAIELFQRASVSKDPQLKAFASKTLPDLRMHLQQAQQLVQVTKRAEELDDEDMPNRKLDTDRGVGSVPPTTRTN